MRHPPPISVRLPEHAIDAVTVPLAIVLAAVVDVRRRFITNELPVTDPLTETEAASRPLAPTERPVAVIAAADMLPDESMPLAVS